LFLRSISSPLGVVGAFAASATIEALISDALSSVIWFSRAAGISMSQSSVSSSSADIS